MSHDPAAPHGSHCRNCGTALQGPYCHACGQHDFEFHRSFAHVFLEALENFLHFDAKFFRNIITLLFRPGQLSAEFNAGKRAAQMPPFRLYLFISVLFFFIRYLGTSVGEVGPMLNLPSTPPQRTELAAALEDQAAATPDPAVRARFEELAKRLREPGIMATPLAADDLRNVPAPLAARIRRELERTGPVTLDAKPKSTAAGKPVAADENNRSELERFLTEKGKFALAHQQELEQAFVHAVPRMLLFCLPLFALFTRLLYFRSGQVYLQHLIIALHYHTFVFLWWPVQHGWQDMFHLFSPTLAGFLGFAAWIWAILYPLLMLRRLFRQSWLVTTLKAAVLGVVYGLTIALGFALTAFIVVLEI